MIPETMTRLMDFMHELKDPSDTTSWKQPGGVRIYRMMETTADERAAGNGVRKRVPVTPEEGIKIILGLERELWKAREAGTWDEDQDYETFCRWNEILLSGIGACPMCSGCEESGINKEIERRRASDPEIVGHFKKVGVDLPAIHKEHREDNPKWNKPQRDGLSSQTPS